jgi:hypothetical protein
MVCPAWGPDPRGDFRPGPHVGPRGSSCDGARPRPGRAQLEDDVREPRRRAAERAREWPSRGRGRSAPKRRHPPATLRACSVAPGSRVSRRPRDLSRVDALGLEQDSRTPPRSHGRANGCWSATSRRHGEGELGEAGELGGVRGGVLLRGQRRGADLRVLLGRGAANGDASADGACGVGSFHSRGAPRTMQDMPERRGAVAPRRTVAGRHRGCTAAKLAASRHDGLTGFRFREARALYPRDASSSRTLKQAPGGGSPESVSAPPMLAKIWRESARPTPVPADPLVEK